ncbi:MAG: hypothetical protein H0W83_07925, partial [Planctomycetes bacterium]|nr:hypothetical protein [Planctomycetota bacterium]
MPLRDLVSVAMFRWSTWIVLALLGAHHAPLTGVEAELRAPLTTVVAVTAPVFEGDKEIRATVTVPADAPADLGVAAFVTDRHGRWYQRLRPGTLAPGTHELRFAMAGLEPLQAQDHHGGWNSAESAKTVRAGLLFWSASASRARLIVEGLQAKADAPPARTEPPRLLDVTLGG